MSSYFCRSQSLTNFHFVQHLTSPRKGKCGTFLFSANVGCVRVRRSGAGVVGRQQTSITRKQSMSPEGRLHHFVRRDKGRLVVAVARGKVAVLLRQLLGFQPDGTQRGRDHHLVPRRSAPPDKLENCDNLGFLKQTLQSVSSALYSKIPANAI